MTHHRRGMTLVELLLMLLIMAVLAAAVGKLAAQAIHFQSTIAHAANRENVMRSLLDHLTTDLLSADQSAWHDGVLTLTRASQVDPRVVRYEFADARVARFVDGRQRDAWEAHRLTFNASVVTGTRGSVLVLELQESVGRQHRFLPHRTMPLALVLPGGVEVPPEEQ